MLPSVLHVFVLVLIGVAAVVDRGVAVAVRPGCRIAITGHQGANASDCRYDAVG